MMKSRLLWILSGWFALAAVAFAAGDPPVVRMGVDAALRLDGDDARLQFVLFTNFGSRQHLETLNETGAKVEPSCSLSYRLVRPGSSVVGAGRATLRSADLGARFAQEITAHGRLANENAGYLLRLRTAKFAGAAWKAGEAGGKLPAEPVHSSVAKGSTKSFALTFPGGRTWTVKFPDAFDFEIWDTRRQDQDEFEICFCSGQKLNLETGKGAEASCTLTASDGKVQCATRDFHGVWQGKSWVKLDIAEGIRPGSALDFSRVAMRKSPAGTEGRLSVTTNGTFRFARASQAPRRFFGCVVPLHKLFADKQSVTAYAKQLTGFGYNAVRLARFDTRLPKTDPKKGLLCDAELVSQFDQFVTAATRDGLYSFYDILSRPEWTWADIGLAPIANRKEPPHDLSAAMCLFDGPAFGKWRELAQVMYGRKNKIGRKTYPEDAAVPLVLAMTDRSPFGAWSTLQKTKEMKDRYAAWLAEKRATDGDFMRGKVCEPASFGVMSLSDPKAASIRQFFAEQEVAGIGRMKDCLLSLKSKALVGAALGNMYYGDVAPLRATAGDFTCCQFALDPTRHLGFRSAPPYRLSNANPLQAKSPVSVTVGWHERPDRALCITSWNVGAHSAWMASSGLLVGAWAAQHGWDALLRDRDPIRDPFLAANERAVFALYARGDYDPKNLACELKLDHGGLTVLTPCTVGGFRPKAGDRIEAGPLTAALKGTRGAVWVSSLSDLPVSLSKRLLLTHLTEMKKEGTLFADSHCDLLMVEGGGSTVVRDGTAEIELEVDKASSFKVFALGADGTRTVRIPAEAKDGKLTFTAAVRGTKNAQYLYELVRE